MTSYIYLHRYLKSAASLQPCSGAGSVLMRWRWWRLQNAAAFHVSRDAIAIISIIYLDTSIWKSDSLNPGLPHALDCISKEFSFSADMSFTQRIVTWNVLSSALSSPSTFIYCERKYLDPEYRLRLVMQHLNQYFCLFPNQLIPSSSRACSGQMQRLLWFFCNNLFARGKWTLETQVGRYVSEARILLFCCFVRKSPKW